MEKRLQQDFYKGAVAGFYEDFVYRNPFLMSFYVVITLGFYGIHIIYELNKRFEAYDYGKKEVPDSRRCLFVMLFLPSLWAYVSFVNAYLFGRRIFAFSVFELIVWAFLIFLILAYLYDFCVVFAKYTQSSPLFWYPTFFPSFLALALLTLGNYTLGIFFFSFTITTFATMQQEMNRRFAEYHHFQRRSHFNTMTREQRDNSNYR